MMVNARREEMQDKSPRRYKLSRSDQLWFMREKLQMRTLSYGRLYIGPEGWERRVMRMLCQDRVLKRRPARFSLVRFGYERDTGEQDV